MRKTAWAACVGLTLSAATSTAQVITPKSTSVESSVLAPETCAGDWAPAINNLIRSNRNPGFPVYAYQQTPEIVLGSSCDTYTVRSPIHFFGARLRGLSPNVGLRCENVEGACLRGHYPKTSVGLGTYNNPGDEYDGVGGPMYLESLVVQGVYTSSVSRASSIGIQGKSGTFVREVRVSGFGTGVVLDCQARAQPSGCPEEGCSNCNGWRMEGVESIGNVAHGFYISGPDSNQGTAIRILTQNNGGWGIDTPAFLGSHFLNVECIGNQAGCIRSTNRNANNLFAGLYVEQDVPPGTTVDVQAPSMVFQAQGGIFTSGSKVIEGGRVRGGLEFLSGTAGGRTLRLGFEPNVMSSYGLSGDEIRFKSIPGVGFCADHANSGSRRAFCVGTNDSPALIDPGHTWFPNPTFHGASGLKVMHVSGSGGLPSPNGLALGSRAWNTDYRPGRALLWVVSTSTQGPGNAWMPVAQ